MTDTFAMISDVQSGAYNYALDTGTVNTYEIALNPPITAYKQGMLIQFAVLNENTNPSTLSINGLEAKPIISPNGNAIFAGQLIPGITYSSVYNETNGGYFVVKNPTTPLETDIWTSADASTQQLYVNNGFVTDNGNVPVIYTLPLTAIFGSLIEISGKSPGLFSVVQNAGQQINYNGKSTTVTTGKLISTGKDDYIRLLCTTADTIWNVVDATGNIIVV